MSDKVSQAGSRREKGDPTRAVDMGRTPCPPAISTEDPRLQTCCLAIGTDKSGRDRVCQDTKGHENPLHDWER